MSKASKAANKTDAVGGVSSYASSADGDLLDLSLSALTTVSVPDIGLPRVDEDAIS